MTAIAARSAAGVTAPKNATGVMRMNTAARGIGFRGYMSMMIVTRNGAIMNIVGTGAAMMNAVMTVRTIAAHATLIVYRASLVLGFIVMYVRPKTTVGTVSAATVRAV
jgi:hypothetical protein